MAGDFTANGRTSPASAWSAQRHRRSHFHGAVRSSTMTQARR
jgi:hypothetical protein